MNSILLLTSCDIEKICDSVIVVVAIIAGVYVIPFICQWLTDMTCRIVRCFKKNDTAKVDASSNATKADDKTKLEIERKKRVLNLMQEICEISRDPAVSKDLNGQFNEQAAKALFKLYIDIDEYDKKENINQKPNVNNGEQK